MSAYRSRPLEAAAAERRESEGLRAGEVARRVGLSKDTLRFYERRGLLEPPRRTANNYRLFPIEVVERLRWIRRALAVGFSVEELAHILAARARGEFPCLEVRSLAAAKLTVLEERLQEMMSFRDALRATLSEWDERLATTPPGQPAGLLEMAGVRAALPSSGLDRKRRSPGTGASPRPS